MTGHIQQEGELKFDFSMAVRAERVDVQGEAMPEGMALVDFMVEEPDRALLIEIKDPSCSLVPHSRRTEFIKKMQGNELINKKLVPKARDSYTFLHLMKRDIKPFLYVVLLGVAQLNIDKALLITFKEQLLKRLWQEAVIPWERQYVTDCVVLTEKSWQKHFPNYGLSRV